MSHQHLATLTHSFFVVFLALLGPFIHIILPFIKTAAPPFSCCVLYVRLENEIRSTNEYTLTHTHIAHTATGTAER